MSESLRPLRFLAPLGLALFACSEAAPAPPPTAVPAAAAEEAPAPVVLPDEVHVETPTEPVELVELVEDQTEEVADRLLDFSDKLRRRDFGSVRTWFADDFAGHGLATLPVASHSTDHLESIQVVYDVSDAPILGADDFTDSLRRLMAPWSRVESVLWKVKAAEFQATGQRRWGKVKLYLTMMGSGADDEPIVIHGWAYARAVKERGQWLLDRFELTALDETRRSATIFSDVTAAAGVARQGIRFGQPGNKSFAWNGSAGGDVDGDGRWDLFSSGPASNVLYVANARGTFDEEAAERGVDGPGGGTGSVFCDFDNDGDQDLFVGHVGWTERSGALGGNLLQAYVNDGSGDFTVRSDALGFTEPQVTYSLLTFDYDNDGYLDFFSSGYGRVEVEHNNSWTHATNGSPNALFKSDEGQRFEDVAEAAGVRGTDWTYAAAAADVDQDGDQDLYLANDYGPNRLLRNDGDGTFTDVAEKYGVVDQGNGMGVTFGDLDNDGRMDLYVSNMSSTAGNRILDRLESDLDPELYGLLKKLAAGNTIFMANGDSFTRVPKEAGGVGANWAWSAALADYDLDGRLDVFCTNGFVTGDLPHDT